MNFEHERVPIPDPPVVRSKSEEEIRKKIIWENRSTFPEEFQAMTEEMENKRSEEQDRLVLEMYNTDVIFHNTAIRGEIMRLLWVVFYFGIDTIEILLRKSHTMSPSLDSSLSDFLDIRKQNDIHIAPKVREMCYLRLMKDLSLFLESLLNEPFNVHNNPTISLLVNHFLNTFEELNIFPVDPEEFKLLYEQKGKLSGDSQSKGEVSHALINAYTLRIVQANPQLTNKCDDTQNFVLIAMKHMLSIEALFAPISAESEYFTEKFHWLSRGISCFESTLSDTLDYI